MGITSGMPVVRVLSGLGAAIIVMMLLLVMYNTRISELENRKNALLLAGQLISRWDGMENSATGIFDTTAVVGGIRFDVRRTVSEVTPGIMEMRLYIGEDGDWSVELARRFSTLLQ